MTIGPSPRLSVNVVDAGWWLGRGHLVRGWSRGVVWAGRNVIINAQPAPANHIKYHTQRGGEQIDSTSALGHGNKIGSK